MQPAQKLLQTQGTESQAIFANVDYVVTEKKGITFGLRYTEEEKVFNIKTFASFDNKVARTPTALTLMVILKMKISNIKL